MEDKVVASQSIWALTAPQGDTYSTSPGDVETEFVIVGGGITGITLAWLLAERGRSAVVLEARRVGEGTTGNSTGNLYQTIASGLASVRDKWGEDGVSEVVGSRGAAIAFIEQRCSELGDECAFRRCPVIRYATDESAHDSLNQEYEALKQVRLPALDVPDAAVPHGRRRAVQLDGQAQFHPLAYVRALARAAAAKGARIFESSPVVDIRTIGDRVTTPGGEVRAKTIVLATHTPKGIYAAHAQMIPHREYGVAVRVRDPFPAGIFWGEGQNHVSLRGFEYNGENYVIVIGGGGKVGLHDAVANQREVEAFAQQHFPDGEIVSRWSAQGYEPPDGLPLIGRSHGTDARLATAFATDGLTYGTLAAMLLADDLTDQWNPWADFYSASRITPIKSGKTFFEEQKTVAEVFVRDRLNAERVETLADIQAGTAQVVNIDGEPVAAYRDDADALTAVSAKCTHMGCIVRWNAAEKSWDCPCHGSRFDASGQVLEGPALKPLAPYEPK